MTDDTQPDLRLLMRLGEKAASDIRTVREATERLTSGWGYRLDAIEARLTGLEQRFALREAAAVARRSSVDKAKPFDIPKQEVWEAFKKVKANQGAAGVDTSSDG